MNKESGIKKVRAEACILTDSTRQNSTRKLVEGTRGSEYSLAQEQAFRYESVIRDEVRMYGNM